jgi:hypothetical protein
MTIGNIGSGYAALCTTPEAQLAVLVLENQEQQQEINQQVVDSARHDFVEHSQQQIEAMRVEADDIAKGAYFEAAAMATGAALQGLAVYEQGKCLPNEKVPAGWDMVRGMGASATNGLSSVLGKALGDSPAADDRADAKQAETAAKQDEWELEDRKGAIQKSEGQQQQAVEWLGKLVDTEAASNQALLSSMA